MKKKKIHSEQGSSLQFEIKNLLTRVCNSSYTFEGGGSELFVYSDEAWDSLTATRQHDCCHFLGRTNVNGSQNLLAQGYMISFLVNSIITLYKYILYSPYLTVGYYFWFSQNFMTSYWYTIGWGRNNNKKMSLESKSLQFKGKLCWMWLVLWVKTGWQDPAKLAKT